MNERSVKISDDERGAWSSDRPRRAAAGPPRPTDVSTRCRVLRMTDRLRYSPGSLVVIASPAPGEVDAFAERIVEERAAVVSAARVRRLLESKVAPDELEERTAQLLLAAITKRLDGGDSVVAPLEGLDRERREELTRLAHARRRPRHIILLDVGAGSLPDEQRAEVNDLRRRLDAGELGEEGFQTALRLSAGVLSDVKKLVFRQLPRDDD